MTFDAARYRREHQNLRAAERLDVLEDELPRGICSVRGCSGSKPLYPWAGAFGTRYLCSRHHKLYRVHDRVLRRIHSIRPRR